eukprot:6207993-Pleurochrysis_carterae.AAC.1
MDVLFYRMLIANMQNTSYRRDMSISVSSTVKVLLRSQFHNGDVTSYSILYLPGHPGDTSVQFRLNSSSCVIIPSIIYVVTKSGNIRLAPNARQHFVPALIIQQRAQASSSSARPSHFSRPSPSPPVLPPRVGSAASALLALATLLAGRRPAAARPPSGMDGSSAGCRVGVFLSSSDITSELRADGIRLGNRDRRPAFPFAWGFKRQSGTVSLGNATYPQGRGRYLCLIFRRRRRRTSLIYFRRRHFILLRERLYQQGRGDRGGDAADAEAACLRTCLPSPSLHRHPNSTLALPASSADAVACSRRETEPRKIVSSTSLQGADCHCIFYFATYKPQQHPAPREARPMTLRMPISSILRHASSCALSLERIGWLCADNFEKDTVFCWQVYHEIYTERSAASQNRHHVCFATSGLK